MKVELLLFLYGLRGQFFVEHFKWAHQRKQRQIFSLSPLVFVVAYKSETGFKTLYKMCFSLIT